ncbi:MAG: 3-dehydroquinate synthase [Bdellovibrionales bacterium]|nr:3-dehydroquinate synthase [Oligoflexia bacterium]
MKIERVRLGLADKSHFIELGAGAISLLPAFVRARKSKKVILISDRSLKQARKKITALLSRAEFEFSEITVTAGESLKDMKSIYPLYGELLKRKADRDTLVLALGGGSIGDAVGFVASTYLRGIDWLGIPTTLLAQVDSSVGGKTGINHSIGKNLIGTFHQPKLVICDTDFLKSLGSREIVSGLGEILKYALTFDPKFLSYLQENMPKLLALESTSLQYAIKRCLQWKCKAVSQDEFDRNGTREVLNFGHTFGHALESLTHYRRYQHGEAVIWGMRFAIALSMQRGHLSERERSRFESVLQRLKVPGLPRAIKPEAYFEAMKKDKKSSCNQIRFVLLDRLGSTISDREVNQADLHQAFALMSTSPIKKVKRG